MIWYPVRAGKRNRKGRYVKLDSAKVRWHRDRLGWTLDTLAEQAEVAEGTAMRAEHGEDIRPSSGRRIARAFGVDISELVPEKPGVVLPKAGAPTYSGPPEKEKPIFDVVRDAVLRQGDQDRQAFTRAAESGYAQTYWKRHENEILARLLKYDPTGELPEAYIDLMWRFLESERDRNQLANEVETLKLRLEEIGV
jgi:transcriptional regulator with XRE-family HTH domain